MKRIFLSTLLMMSAASIVAFENCSRGLTFSQDSSLQNSSSVAAPTCTLSTTLKTLPTKVIFLLDQSASNDLSGLKNPDGTLQDFSTSTDPQRTFRTSALSTLTSLNPASQLLQYSMTGFWSHGATAVRPLWTNGFVADPADVASAITLFSSKTTPCALLDSSNADYQFSDCGGTPYVDALKNALSQIDAGDDYRYVVIMITDGLPSGSSHDPTVIAQAKADVMTEVNALMAAKSDKVFLNTVYYFHGAADPNAVKFVSDMATAGQGTSLAVDSSENIDLGTELKLITQSCQ